MALGRYVMASIGIGAACVALAIGHLSRVDTFAQPARTAIERLAAKQRVVEGTGLGSLTIKSAGTAQETLRLSVTGAGEPRSVICRVTVSTVSSHTSRADTDCTQPNAGDQPMRRLGSKALAIVVREHVAATIEDRRYDIDRVANRMIAFAVMNGPAIAASMSPPRE